MHEFETERLKMRLLEPEDKELFVSLYSDTKTMRYIASPFSAKKINSSFQTALSLNSASKRKQLMWTILDTEHHQKLGVQSLTINEEQAEIGIILARLSHGKGVPEESITGLIQYAFKKLALKQIFAVCDKRNFSTLRVIRKLGFVEEIINGTESRKFVIKPE